MGCERAKRPSFPPSLRLGRPDQKPRGHLSARRIERRDKKKKSLRTAAVVPRWRDRLTLKRLAGRNYNGWTSSQNTSICVSPNFCVAHMLPPSADPPAPLLDES